MIKCITEYIGPTDKEYWEFSPEVIERDKQGWIGHKGDNSRNANFNNKLYRLIGKENFAYILDIGCCHGEAIIDFIQDGNIGIGLDMNPMGLLTPTWLKYKDINFFQCDVGKPFTLLEDDKIIIFDAIMSWECFEHIIEKDIDCVLSNIDKHSRIGTLLILSIGKSNESNHRTVKDRSWWILKFNKLNFIEKDMDFGNDLIRNLPGITEYFFMVKI